MRAGHRRRDVSSFRGHTGFPKNMFEKPVATPFRPGMNARATWETKSRLKPAPKSEPLRQEPGSPGFSVEA